MKLFFRIYLCILFLLLIGSGDTFSQCVTGTSGGTIVIGNAWSSTGTTSVPGRTYYSFAATAGFTYYFSFCAADGGVSTKNTELTLLTNFGIPVAGAYNDDFCGFQSYLVWTCPSSGTYKILATKSGCAVLANLGTMVYRFTAPLSCPGNLGAGMVNVPSLPFAAGAGTTCGAVDDLNSSNTIACGNTTYLGGEDKVFIFTPAITGTITVTLTSSGTGNSLVLYRGCPLIGQGGTCVAVSQSSAGNQSFTACVNSGVTYYLILDNLPSPICNPYTDLTISAPVSLGGCSLGSGVNNISLPYVSNGRTTCGKINDLTSANMVNCGSSLYFTGEDEVFIFTAATTGNININLTSTGTYTGLMLYAGCPLTASCTGIASTCVTFEQSSSGSKSICAAVTAGITYYLVVDSWSTPVCNPYDISISSPIPSLAGSICANAIVIPSLPFSRSNESTSCTGNNYSSASTGSCGTFYESGEDLVYQYTASSSECLGINLSGASSNSIGFQVYSGCPGTAGTVCIGNGGGASSGNLNGSVTLPSAGVYYIIVDSWAPPNNVSYNISITSFGAGAINDLACNATPLPLGIYVTGANNCSGGASEPVPSCWSIPNTLNTVWFSAVAPASGSLRVRVLPETMTNPQVALFSGNCNFMVQQICNDDAAGCGSSSNNTAEVLIGSLIPGQTYFISVDGYGNQTGTFGVIAIDGLATLPALSNGQDCGNFLPVCDTSMSFGDPGFQSFGNNCDYNGSGSNCLLSGERGSVWFEIPINANGNLEFSIIPKDWLGAPSTTGTDYDFAVFKTLGTGAVSCAQIATGVAPVSCNYNYLGVTGCFGASTGMNPAAYPGFSAAFNASIPVLNGEKYVLVISNFSNSTSGFDIIFGNTSPVSYSSVGTASTWSGGADSDWFKKINWGGCPVPDCSRDAIINGGTVLQPSINGAAFCKSIIINPGATLTLLPVNSLSVCGDFTNYGLFNAAVNSTLIFPNGSVVQQLNGTLNGSNAPGNFTVSKTGGSVNILQNLDVKGSFLIANAASVFNTNSKYHKQGGNFTNNGTYIPSVIEFNGSTPQTYFSIGALKDVIMNKSTADLSLLSNMQLNTTGSLQLLNGKIITAAFSVDVLNRTGTAVNSGNAGSYVEGNLRRYINSQGSYDFPVGESTKGYQRARIDFSYPLNATAIDNLSVSFAPYAALPIALGAVDCSITYSSSALNNGKWTFTASNNPTSGNFDLTLYNANYTNAASVWTIMRNTGSGWTMGNGNCVVSPVTAVRRNAMNGMGEFGTAQGPSTLPVSLLYFNADAQENIILLKWSTASEENNRGFEIERSEDGINFIKIGWEDGAGNSSDVVFYELIDDKIKAEVLYYYRLKQIDFDGRFEYSEIESAMIHGNSYAASVHPNPFSTEAVLSYYLNEKSPVEISLINVLGEEVYIFRDSPAQKGWQEWVIRPASLGVEPGWYHLVIRTASTKVHLKVLINR